LHRRPNAVAIAEEDVVAHSDFVAVRDHRRPRQREEQRVHQLDLPAIVAEQRREPPADAEVDARFVVICIDLIHEQALFLRDHFER
jgi:hypothetical protein